MKAMSIGLFKGTIDEVEQTIRITWVKPRLLSKDRLAVMKDKLSKWKDTCEGTFKLLESHASEIL